MVKGPNGSPDQREGRMTEGLDIPTAALIVVAIAANIFALVYWRSKK